MTGFSFEGRVMADLGQQIVALREDLQRATTQWRRAALRIEQLEAALREVRDLLPHLPPHDQATEVAVRLRGHFDYLATHIISDALAVVPPLEAIPPEGAAIDGE